MNMKKLMNPESLVVIGASDKKGMVGGATRSSVKGVNKDRVYFLNPKRDEVLGKKCYHSLSELPEIPDCMLLCTPSHTVPVYLEEAGKSGIGAAVVLASGFSEERSEEAKALSDHVKEICQKYDIALCGPNCIGIVNGIDKVCVTANNDETMTMLLPDKRRGAGVIAQSGYISSGFNNPDCDYLACVVSAGNSIICGMEDYMLYFAEEDRINVIAAYIEGITKPDVLEKALRTAALKRKPVVVLKAGSSEKGGFAAASHTGSLAGNYKGIQSVFGKFGVIFTHSLQELVSTTRMFAILDGNFPAIPTVGGINFSGGENTLCADTCERYGISLPDFGQETLDIIKSVVPPFATAANPLDATTSLFSEREKVFSLFRAISNDSAIGLITIGNDVGLNSEPKDLTCADVLSQMSTEKSIKTAVVIPSFEKTRNADVRRSFEKAGIPVLSSGDFAYESIKHLLDFSSFIPDENELQLALPNLSHADGKTPAKITLSEADSKKELASFGVKVPSQAIVTSEKELETALKNFTFPVVMKVDSNDIPHKTEAHAVKLNIGNAKEAKAAFQKILKNCHSFKPDAKINGICIQEQLKPGTEILVGITMDKQFGPLLLCGMGGIYTELFSDIALCPCPVSEASAEKMLKRLKISKLFDGYRGNAPLDTDALIKLMSAVSKYAVENKDTLAELDLNPVFVYEKGCGCCAADALIVKYKS